MPVNKEITHAGSSAVPISRRGFLGKAIRGTAAAASAAVTAAGSPAFAKSQVSKAEAHYQDHPDKAQHCGGCVHFVFGGCTKVEGSISSNGWCKFFQAA
jgi:hypothetical protein